MRKVSLDRVKPGMILVTDIFGDTGQILLGFEIYKTTGIFDARAGAVVLQHYERYQGQG